MKAEEKKLNWPAWFVTVLCCAIPAMSADAATLGFFCITNSSAVNCAAGEAQLSVDVIVQSASQVRFQFNNSGPAASSITDVYFDDGALLGIAQIINSPGVSFSQGASPPNLPGANNVTPSFQTTVGFLADSDPAVQPNGVNPGETLGIVFNLQSGTSYSDVISNLTDGTLRVGIHVQWFSEGGSESFVNNPVPIPAAVWFFGSGLLGLAGMVRHKKKRK